MIALFLVPVPALVLPTTRRIYLVRHGETLYGAGATSGDDLTPEGYRQIEALELLLRPTAVDAIYANPLGRAQATARTLAGPSGVPITTVDSLREIVPGALSLLTTSSTRSRRVSKRAAWILSSAASSKRVSGSP